MKIRLHQSWRPGGRDINGRELLLHPGDYNVPHDLSEALAARAIKECNAEHLDAPQPQPKAKGPAPENKATIQHAGPPPKIKQTPKAKA